jgi:hypothetical protein
MGGHGGEVEYRELSTIEIIKRFIFSKIKENKQKQSFSAKKENPLPPPPENVNINHIAIILDGRVEEVIRCENRLAALLLSEPIFVEFDPSQTKVSIGSTEYTDKGFENKQEEFSEGYMDHLIEQERKNRDNV